MRNMSNFNRNSLPDAALCKFWIMDLYFFMDLDFGFKMNGFGFGLGFSFANGFGFVTRWIWSWTWIQNFQNGFWIMDLYFFMDLDLDLKL